MTENLTKAEIEGLIYCYYREKLRGMLHMPLTPPGYLESRGYSRPVEPIANLLERGLLETKLHLGIVCTPTGRAAVEAMGGDDA